MVDSDYVCSRCHDQISLNEVRRVNKVEVDITQLGMEASFCYLGDLLSAGGDYVFATICRCCTDCGKSRNTCLFLHVSFMTRVKVFTDGCSVHRLHGSVNRMPSAPNVASLLGNDR